MELSIFYIIAIIGLVILTIGVITKNRKKQNIYFMIGGILLLIYSISIKNMIFITLQSIFTIAAIYNLVKLK